MDTKIFTADKEKAISKMKSLAKSTGLIVVLLVFALIVAFSGMLLLKPAEANGIKQLTDQKVQIELSLQSTLVQLQDAKKKVETLSTSSDDLRNKRDTLTKQIDSMINPEYKPEIDVKK